jgi:hypothetical protein
VAGGLGARNLTVGGRLRSMSWSATEVAAAWAVGKPNQTRQRKGTTGIAITAAIS